MIFFFQETVNKLLLNFFHDKQKTKCEWDIKFNLKFLSMGELGVDWGGVYMRKLAPVQVSYGDDFLILYRVYMMTGSFHISLFEGTLHVDKLPRCHVNTPWGHSAITMPTNVTREPIFIRPCWLLLFFNFILSVKIFYFLFWIWWFIVMIWNKGK